MTKIKSLKPSLNSPYKQGYYTPKNTKKYIGKNPKIIHRSGLELKFCKICDMSNLVSAWSSEELVIKYLNPIDKKVHDYYPDFFVRMSNGTKWLVEIKAANKLKKPKKPSKFASNKSWINYYKNLREFIIINAKKKASEQYCAKFPSCYYIMITEKSDILKKFK